jgi:DNA modification methylase
VRGDVLGKLEVEMKIERYITADAETGLKLIQDGIVDTCITSPPYYGLRDYGSNGQIGLEPTPEEYIERLVRIFREVKRVLKDDGTLWIVIGDSYAGSHKGQTPNNNGIQDIKRSKVRGMTLPTGTIENVKPKDLIGIPWMLAFALRADGWYLRQDIIWHKPNAMPESVKDRCTGSHEHILLLAKSRKYYYNADAIAEPAAYDGRKKTQNKGSGKRANKAIVPGKPPQTLHVVGQAHERWRIKDRVYVRNKRDVWSVSTKPYRGAHFATFPPDLIRPCILAGSRPGGIVIDPFFGSGTTGLVAIEEGRCFIGIDINQEYMEIARSRINGINEKKGENHG